jgi:hypothetical protein
MASRAHVLYDYPLHRDSHAPRRGARRSTDDPVVLPRVSAFSMSGGLIIAALTAGALVAGSAFDLFRAPAPAAMAETPMIPLERDYSVDQAPAAANVTNQLSGPAHAVPQVGNMSDVEPSEDVPLFSSESSPVSSDNSRGPEVIINDSAPGAQESFPQPPSATPAVDPAPYPNPTTTPPDAIAPESAPGAPTPVLEPENPYR